ncbi:MAG: ClpXP protease specificity-enhancing factor [Gammaproteobacteria bacterium]
MTSTRPYLLRAIYEWIVDNGCTPHVVLEAADGVNLPPAYVSEGRLVLNVSPSAVRDLDIANDALRCSARFGGVATPIDVPMRHVRAIYARENGRGIAFSDDDSDTPTPAPDGSPPRGRPKLKLVE